MRRTRARTSRAEANRQGQGLARMRGEALQALRNTTGTGGVIGAAAQSAEDYKQYRKRYRR